MTRVAERQQATIAWRALWSAGEGRRQTNFIFKSGLRTYKQNENKVIVREECLLLSHGGRPCRVS